MFKVNNKDTKTTRKGTYERTWKIHARSELNFETFYNMRTANT